MIWLTVASVTLIRYNGLPSTRGANTAVISISTHRRVIRLQTRRNHPSPEAYHLGDCECSKKDAGQMNILSVNQNIVRAVFTRLTAALWFASRPKRRSRQILCMHEKWSIHSRMRVLKSYISLIWCDMCSNTT